MITKKYKLTRMFSAVLTFRLVSRSETITFANGSRHHGRNGYFVTSDEELQEAIEKSPYFGTEIIVAEQTINEETPKQEEPQEATIINYREMLTDAESSIEAPEVTTIQKAKMWLQANYGKSFKGTTKDEIKKEAAATYNVIFPNWL